MNRILLVEDNETVAAVSVDLLASFEYEPALASSGEEMLTTLDNAVSPFDVIVLDAILPDMRCEESLKAIRGRNYGGPVIVWTGAFESLPPNLMRPEFGQVSVIVKGNPMDLLDALAEITGNKSV